MVLFNSKTRHLLTAWVSSLLLVGSAHAQPVVPSAAPPTSAFESYKPYTDEPVGNWKTANDTTARIGGWREYARQAQGLGSKPENMPAPVTKAGETMPEPLKKATP